MPPACFIPCFCTRADIAAEIAAAASRPHELTLPSPLPAGLPPAPSRRAVSGTCRRLTPEQVAARLKEGSYALRLDSPWSASAGRSPSGNCSRFSISALVVAVSAQHHLGDVVLGRKEIRASYHYRVTHDDQLQGVSLATRGEDLFHATHLYRVLQVVLGWPEPAYAHHPLLTDAHGDRLAKRRGSLSLRSLRAQGLSAEAIWAPGGSPSAALEADDGPWPLAAGPWAKPAAQPPPRSGLPRVFSGSAPTS